LVGPEDLDQFAPAGLPVPVEDEVGEELTPLAPGELPFEPLAAMLDDQGSTELDPGRAADFRAHPNIVAIHSPTERGGSCMARIIRCECGFVARGTTDDEVVDAIRSHMTTDHPALLEAVQRDDLLGWIQLE
jgi:predicted small metal-binding protein